MIPTNRILSIFHITCTCPIASQQVIQQPITDGYGQVPFSFVFPLIDYGHVYIACIQYLKVQECARPSRPLVFYSFHGGALARRFSYMSHIIMITSIKDSTSD